MAHTNSKSGRIQTGPIFPYVAFVLLEAPKILEIQVGQNQCPEVVSGGSRKVGQKQKLTVCKLGALQKARLRKVRFSGDFLGAFDFLRSACSLEIPLKNPLN